MVNKLLCRVHMFVNLIVMKQSPSKALIIMSLDEVSASPDMNLTARHCLLDLPNVIGPNGSHSSRFEVVM